MCCNRRCMCGCQSCWGGNNNNCGCGRSREYRAGFNDGFQVGFREGACASNHCAVPLYGGVAGVSNTVGGCGNAISGGCGCN